MATNSATLQIIWLAYVGFLIFTSLKYDDTTAAQSLIDDISRHLRSTYNDLFGYANIDLVHLHRDELLVVISNHSISSTNEIQQDINAGALLIPHSSTSLGKNFILQASANTFIETATQDELLSSTRQSSYGSSKKISDRYSIGTAIGAFFVGTFGVILIASIGFVLVYRSEISLLYHSHQRHKNLTPYESNPSFSTRNDNGRYASFSSTIGPATLAAYTNSVNN
eukprot:gene8745-1128_t